MADGDSPQRPFAIIVVNYGSADLLAQNLAASVAVSNPDAVIVVDNFSDEAERERVDILATAHGWEVLPSATNLGFGGGVNAGVNVAINRGIQDFLVLNPDASVNEGCVERLRAQAQDDQFTVCAPHIVTSDGRTWFAGADVYLTDGRTRGWTKRAAHVGQQRWEWLTGACLWIPIEIWNATGGFDESYFLYWEDVDFSRKVVNAGGRLAVVPDAIAVHDEGGTHRSARQSNRAKSEVYYYYNIRNRMLFAAVHLNAAGIRRWRSHLNASTREILLRGGKLQFLRSLAPWRAGLQGTRDARRIAREALRGSS